MAKRKEVKQSGGKIKKDGNFFFSLDQWIDHKVISDRWVLIKESEMKEAWSRIRANDTVDDDGLPSCGGNLDHMFWILTNKEDGQLSDQEEELITKHIYRRAEALRKKRPEDHPYNGIAHRPLGEDLPDEWDEE